MKLIVSKVFANYINQCAKEMGFKVNAEVVELNECGYTMRVGDTCDAVDYDDYMFNEDGDYRFKAIKLTYPDNYYAMPQYLSTKRIHDEWVRRNGKNESDLREMIKELCEI